MFCSFYKLDSENADGASKNLKENGLSTSEELWMLLGEKNCPLKVISTEDRRRNFTSLRCHVASIFLTQKNKYNVQKADIWQNNNKGVTTHEEFFAFFFMWPYHQLFNVSFVHNGFPTQNLFIQIVFSSFDLL